MTIQGTCDFLLLSFARYGNECLILGNFHNCQRWLFKLSFRNPGSFLEKEKKKRKDCITAKWKLTSTHVGCSFLMRKGGGSSSINTSFIIFQMGDNFFGI
jgi:hypothetical protein